MLIFKGPTYGMSLNLEVERLLSSLEQAECEVIGEITYKEAISTANILNAAVSYVTSTKLGKDLYDYSIKNGTQIKFLTSIENSGEKTDFMAEYDERTDFIVLDVDAVKGFVKQRQDAGSALSDAEEEVGRLISPILINELTHSYVYHFFKNEFGIILPADLEEELLSDAITAAFIRQIAQQVTSFLRDAETLRFTFTDPVYLEVFRNSELNLGRLYKGYERAATAESVQGFKRKLVDRIANETTEEAMGFAQEGFLNGSLGAHQQDLGKIVIPPRNLEGLVGYVDQLIGGNHFLLEIRKNPEGDVARSISGSVFGTVNRPSVKQIEKYINDLQKTREFMKNPRNVDQADSQLQRLFERAYNASR
jgi:hypothetical protein